MLRACVPREEGRDTKMAMSSCPLSHSVCAFDATGVLELLAFSLFVLCFTLFLYSIFFLACP
ncbi:hypothetical protein BDA96_04G015700 [Sorghum bicolor]|uniref:Uncharacterized protein n=1 Tax=Sorghum bicolor TaxID=4558 RepID=A0A921R0E7_SORBI|nr:hypothetical protein BDA96_04G015700 [Sorghum bicolor]